MLRQLTHHVFYGTLTIGVRGGGTGEAAATSGLKNFRANSVFRATASSSKILNNKTYFSTEKNFRAALFFRTSANCSKILNNKKYTFNTVNSGHPLLFRASASYSKILNVKRIFNTVKNSRVTLFSGQAQVTQNSRIIKKIFKTEKNFRASASCSKILNNKKNTFNTVNSGHQGKRKLFKNPECKKYIS